MLDGSDTKTLTACGTPCWAAPEILRNERYTTKADVFSFGVVLWECVARDVPYANMPPFQVVFAVGTRGLRPDLPADCPAAIGALIEACWAESPEERPSFDDVLARLGALEASWIKAKAPRLAD